MEKVLEFPEDIKKHRFERKLRKEINFHSALHGLKLAQKKEEAAKQVYSMLKQGKYRFQFSFDEERDQISQDSLKRFEAAVHSYTGQCYDNLKKLLLEILDLKLEIIDLEERLGVAADKV